MSHFMSHLYESYYMTLPATLDMNNQAKRIQKGWYWTHSFFVLFTVSIKLLAGSRDPRIKPKLSGTKRFGMTGPDQDRTIGRTGPDQDQQALENLGSIMTRRSVEPWLEEQATVIETNLICYQYNSWYDQQGYMPTEINSWVVTYNEEYHRVHGCMISSEFEVIWSHVIINFSNVQFWSMMDRPS